MNKSTTPVPSQSRWLSVVLGPTIDTVQEQMLGDVSRAKTLPQSNAVCEKAGEADCISSLNAKAFPAWVTDALLQRPSVTSTPRAIPKPPNGFILFRSKFLKEANIPKDVENRQQSLSRVAGQAWRLMTEDERSAWKSLAKEEAMRRNSNIPSYKLARAVRRVNGKDAVDRNAVERAEFERAVMLRQSYTGFRGEVQPSIRIQRNCEQNWKCSDPNSSPPSHAQEVQNTPNQGRQCLLRAQLETVDPPSFKSFDYSRSDHPRVTESARPSRYDDLLSESLRRCNIHSQGGKAKGN